MAAGAPPVVSVAADAPVVALAVEDALAVWADADADKLLLDLKAQNGTGNRPVSLFFHKYDAVMSFSAEQFHICLSLSDPDTKKPAFRRTSIRQYENITGIG